MLQSAESHSATASAPSPPRLLRTKLLVPQTHPDVVGRPRLLSRLDRCPQYPLTLISAAAGFGKTTLLSAWVMNCGSAAVWVSLDARDNDPTRFWSYAIAALQTRWPEIGQTAQAMLHAPQPPPIEGVLTALLNDIAGQAEPCILVLDDYHAVTDAAIHQGVAYLVDHLPPQVHLILASRADPPLPLARLRARRQLLEVRGADLRFTQEEAEAFFNQVMGLTLAADDVATVDALVEGWAAGLQLAALSLQEMPDIAAFVHAFSGSHRYIFDYLAHEVFQRQSEAVQSFMLRTAPLHRLSGDLCDALTGRHDSQHQLEALERANLFLVPLDPERRWYRYHHLFSDFLGALMRETLSPDACTELHRRASRWYAAHEEPHDAIHHALAADDVSEAVNLVKAAARAQFERSELRTVLGWLQALPADVVVQDAHLGIIGGWATLAMGRGEETASYVAAAEAALHAESSGAKASLPRHVQGGLAEIAIIRASLAFNRMDLADVMAQCRRAQAYLRPGVDGIFNERLGLLGIVAFDAALASEYSGDTAAAVRAFEAANDLFRQDVNSHVLPMSLSHLAQLQVLQGQLRAAAVTYERARAAADSGAVRSPLGGLAFTGWGTLLYEWDDLASAGAFLRQGLELGERWSEWEIILAGYGGLIRIALACGETDRARELLDTVDAEAERMHVAWVGSTIEGFRALVAHDQDAHTIVEAWAKTLIHMDAGPISYAEEPQALLLARLLVGLGRLDRALALLARLLPQLRAQGRMGRVIEARVIEAAGLDAQGERLAALDALTEALTLAEPEGYLRTFIDAGERVFALLEEITIAPAYTARLLTAARQARAADETPDGAEPSDPPAHSAERVPAQALSPGALLDPLSDRELEVLALVAEGLTNQAIANRLFISINTVKTHARHIYEKLDVHNRAQAARKAMALNLLD